MGNKFDLSRTLAYTLHTIRPSDKCGATARLLADP